MGIALLESCSYKVEDLEIEKKGTFISFHNFDYRAKQ